MGGELALDAWADLGVDVVSGWDSGGVSRRILTVGMAPLLFGAAVELVKADQGWAFGVRSDAGNLSAPWLLVALVVGFGAPTVLRGALGGLVATESALVGFYVAEAMVFAGHLGASGPLGDLAIMLRAGLVFFVLGALSGPLTGAMGAWLGQRHRTWMLPVAGALLAGEPLVAQLVAGHPLLPAPLYLALAGGWSMVSVIEIATGAGILLAGLLLARRADSPTSRAC